MEVFSSRYVEASNTRAPIRTSNLKGNSVERAVSLAKKKYFSQLTTHNSQLTTHNSQLTTHNSQLTTTYLFLTSVSTIPSLSLITLWACSAISSS